MNLLCQMCGKITVLTEDQDRRIRLDLARLGPGAAHVHECNCGRYQFVLCLTPEKPRWTLAEVPKAVASRLTE